MKANRIAYPDSPFHAIAWRDCLAWAIQDDDRLAEFAESTGVALASPLTTAEAERFVAWFNTWIWGADPFVAGIPVFSEPEDGDHEALLAAKYVSPRELTDAEQQHAKNVRLS